MAVGSGPGRQNGLLPDRYQQGNLTDVAWSEHLVIAVGHKGITLVSSDEGKTWKAVPTGLTLALHRVAVAGDLVLVVGEKGTVIQTEIGKRK
jgi:photosystem II stability/assembly factor-like uncharacterized protein